MTQTNLSENPPVRTQFMIFTLFGDYILDCGGTIWTSSLLKLMSLLGLSERAVRSTLSRMSRKGWVKPKKLGRRSQYSLTPHGRTLLERGQTRIFESIFTDWDQSWHVVVYSLPEEKRRIRQTLRRQLSWLGFGCLAPGTWISPHSRRLEIKSLLSELEIKQYVDQFSGIYLGPAAECELVSRCWDITGLEEQYVQFSARFMPEYQNCLTRRETQDGLEPQECFIKRFWLTHEYQSFHLNDPNLPTKLLPDDWIGNKARKLFVEYHRLLGDQAQKYVNAIMKNDEK